MGSACPYLSFSDLDYLELVDSTGRIQREDKRGHISHHSREVLERIGINPKAFTQQMHQSGLGFSIALGCQESLRAFAGMLNQHFIKDGGLSQWLFDDPELE